jgi:hypothetical protein
MCRKEYPSAAPLIDGNMYVDDFVAGVDDENAAIRIYYELTALMETIKLPLAKWATISEEPKGIWNAEGQKFKGQHKPWA